VQGEIVQGYCIMIAYIGLVLGDVASGSISQMLRSRKKAMTLFYIACSLMIITYLNLQNVSTQMFYAAILGLGFSVGFWALFVTNAAEQFGINLRATAATSIPNFARALIIPIAWFYKKIMEMTNGNIILSYWIEGAIIMAITFATLFFVRETFARDLDFYEE
jgi:hypothetical protein